MDSAGAITGWNQGAELMFGYAESEVAGQHFRLLFVPEDRASCQAEEELRQAQAHGRAIDERWHLRKDGSRFFASGITSTFVEGGAPAFAKIARDLTERQRMEKQQAELLQAEQQVRKRLEAASAARSEFLAVMSHELKSPLNLIALSADLLRTSPAVKAVAHLNRAAETIRRTVQGQARIIDDLLDLSRLSTGKLALHRAAVSLRAVVMRIVEALAAQAESKGVALRVKGEDLTIDADDVRLEQIVWNLVNNAIKFTPHGGEVSINLSGDGDSACITVQDSGRGISSDFLPSIFNMFAQEDSGAATRKDGGLGIGLALVKSLVDLHGGSVHASSEGTDRGARFEVRLPMPRRDAGTHESNAPTGQSPLAGVRILVVEDDEDSLQALEALLIDLQLEVTTATNAEQALQRASEQTFDVLLSDIGLSGVDGRTLLGLLRRQPGFESVTAIAVSGFGRPEDVQASLAAGFDLHLGKPTSIDTLEDLIQRLLAKKR